MGRFDGGWIKMHRKIFSGDIAHNPNCFLVWSWLLVNANYKESKIIWNGSEQRILVPGQVIFGVREIAEQLSLSKDTVLRWLSYLSKTDRITVESSTRGSLATIRNWEIYQGEGDDDETLSDTPSRRQPDTDKDAHKDINEEVQEIKNNNIDSKSISVIPELRDPVTDQLLAKTTMKQQLTWLAIYQNPQWIKAELKTLFGWLESNPNKKPKGNKGPAARINNWLASAKRRGNDPIHPNGVKHSHKKEPTIVPFRSKYAD